RIVGTSLNRIPRNTSIEHVLTPSILCRKSELRAWRIKPHPPLIRPAFFQTAGSGYDPTPTLTTRKSGCFCFMANVASAIAYSVGLLAQNPPSATSTASPLLFLMVWVSKNGQAEQEAIIASATGHPKKGTKEPAEPCACVTEALKMSGRSSFQFVATIPTAVFKSSTFVFPKTVTAKFCNASERFAGL